jgi:acetolactate synthase I/II/III large subunit
MTLAPGHDVVSAGGSASPRTGWPESDGPRDSSAALPAVEMRLARLPWRGDTDWARRAVEALLVDEDGGIDSLAVGWALAGGRRVLEQRLSSLGRAPATTLRHALDSAVPALGRRVQLSVAELLALRCQQHQVASVFAYPGTSELALCQALGALGERVLVNARGDAEAVFMAGGAGMSGGIAAAVVHGARGLTNATGAISVLRRNELPALVLVGLPSTSSAPFLPPHGEPKVVETVGAFAKSACHLTWSSSHGDTVPVPDPIAAVDMAMAIARTLPRGPVLLGVPQDVLEWRGVSPETVRRPVPPAAAPTEPSSNAVSEGRELVRRAGRVVVVVDDYLLAIPEAIDALAAFSSVTAAPVFQVRYRRGPMLFQRLSTDQVPRFVGWYDPADPDHRRTMAEADLLVTVEDRNLYQRVVGTLPDCRKVAVTSDAGKARKNGYLREGDLVLEGSPVALLRVLADLPTDSSATGRVPMAGRCPGAASGVRSPGEPATDAAPRLAVVLAQAVRRCLRLIGGDVIVDDSQMLGGLLTEAYDEALGTATVRGDHSGFVGAGLSLATGLAIGSSRPVLCLLGDQGFTNGFQGLVAAAQEAASVLYLVANNGESVSLRKQAAALGVGAPSPGFDRLLRNCPTFDYVRAASGAGVTATRVDATGWHLRGEATASQICWAAERVWRPDGGPALVEIVLPPLGPDWDGVWAIHGHEEAPTGDPTIARTMAGRPHNGPHVGGHR